MIKLKATSLRETHEIASQIAGLTSAGDLILLVGGLGAGKTAFAQGLGKHSVLKSQLLVLLLL